MRSHFLHIGKTGGTALKHVFAPIAKEYDIHIHPHHIPMGLIPKGEKVFFFVREPVERFVSAFYSRQRQGMPRYRSPWNGFEARAFSFFNTANSLAEAISSPDQALNDEAMNAMYGIQHINQTYRTWFKGFEEIEGRSGDILLIGHQPELNEDFERLKVILGLPPDLSLPSDPIQSHRQPAGFDRSLSELATENLRKWYAKDIEFYEKCMSFRKEMLAKMS